MAHVNRFHVRSAITAALAVIALTACGGDDDMTSSATADVEPAAQPAGERAINDDATTDAPATPTLPPSGAAAVDTPPADRLLIVEVTVGVEVADVGATVSDIIAIGDRYGGQVYGSDVRLNDLESSRGTIVVKVPPQNVEAMIADVSALGRLVSRVQNTDDVTDRVTDIDTRVATARDSVERVQRLLAEAKDLGEVVLLESELTSRQTTLEELLAQQRDLGNRTALATLTIDLSTVPASVLTDVADPRKDDGIGHAFREGGRAFVTAGAAVLIFVGYTAPFLAVALVAGGVLLMIIRRPRRNRSAAPPPPPAPAEDPRTSEHDSAGAART